jgi:hypothetical protein
MSTVVAVTAALGLVTTGSVVAATGASAAKKPVPRLVVVPSGSLRNKETVRVRGINFIPKDSVYLVECLATAKGQSNCDTATATPVTINAKGQLPWTTFTVLTGTIGNGTCGTTRANAKACELSVGNIEGKDTASTRITFVVPGAKKTTTTTAKG